MDWKKQRHKRLEKQIAALSAPRILARQVDPLPKKIIGRVRAVTRRNVFVLLDFGSEAGVIPGMEFILYSSGKDHPRWSAKVELILTTARRSAAIVIFRRMGNGPRPGFRASNVIFRK